MPSRSVAFWLLAAPDVKAGSYSGPVYSGGTFLSQSGPIADSLTSQGYGGGSGGIIGDTSCSGSLTASFKWTPDPDKDMTTDPPPTTVVVAETCTVNIAPTVPQFTGSYDTGLGKSGSLAWAPGSANAITVTSVRYTSHAGGASVSLPSVKASASATRTGSSCGVRYTATVYPVFVIPGGAVKDTTGSYNILVGQGCTASLSGIPTALMTNTPPSPTYSWSVTGTTFQDWEPTTPAFPFANPPTLANSQASYYSGGPGPLTNATAKWYWNDPNNTTETISCTAQLTPPAGQGSAFSVTATQKVSVVIPPFTCNQYQGVVALNLTSRNVTVLQAVGISQTYPHGETWICKVQTPALFGSGGSCNFCQIITPERSHTYGSGTVLCTQNNITGLDLLTPYGTESSDPYTVNKGLPNAGWPADNSQHRTGDSPSTGVADSTLGVAENININNEQFFTSLMYLPPGSDVKSVPLYLMGWVWSGQPSEPAGGWVVPGPIMGTVASTPTSGANTFPNWTLIEGVTVGSGW